MSQNNRFGKLILLFLALTTVSFASARVGWQTRLQFLDRCSQASKEAENHACYDTFRTLYPLTATFFRSCQKVNPQGKYPFTKDETWESAFEALEECTETCSEGCLYVVREIKSRYSVYYAKYFPREKSDSRSTKRRSVTPEEAEFICTAVQGLSFNGDVPLAGAHQKNFNGFGLTLLGALHSACNKCGGNSTFRTTDVSASFTCILSACATADRRDIPKTDWERLIPADCTRSHNHVRDFRGAKPSIRNWRPN